MAHIRQVYDTLHEIDAALVQLRVLVLQERQDIVGLNLAALAERRVAIETLLVRIGDLNTRVTGQIKTACDDSGLTGERTLSQLIKAVPKPDRDMYAHLQKTVRAGSAAAENELVVNKALLKDSLAFTAYSLQMFTGILKTNSSSTYGYQGRFVESTDQPRIICKEI